MTNPNMFSQMYLVPKYLYQHLKNTLDFEQTKQLDNMNSVSTPEESKNMSENSLNTTEVNNTFSTSNFDLNNDINEKEKNHVLEQSKKIRKNPWLTCKICGVKKNGQKQMDEHMKTAHSEIVKNEKNSTPKKQNDVKKTNTKTIENISPIRKKQNISNSNFLLYN